MPGLRTNMRKRVSSGSNLLTAKPMARKFDALVGFAWLRRRCSIIPSSARPWMGRAKRTCLVFALFICRPRSIAVALGWLGAQVFVERSFGITSIRGAEACVRQFGDLT